MTFKLPRLDLPTTVICVLTVAAFVRVQLFDPDYFFHLRTGEWLLEHGRLPETDPFSFTRPDAQWLLFEWLFQSVLAAVHSVLGTLGVRILIAVLALVTFTMIYRTTRRMASETMALAIAVVGISVLLSINAPRPQWVTYAMLATFLWALVTFLQDRSVRSLVLLPFLMVIWANAHGGFMAGLILLAVALGLQWVSARTQLGDPEGTRRTIRPLALCLAACALAATLNPYGIELLLYPFKVMLTASTRLILEWQPPTFRRWDTLVVLGMAGCLLLLQPLRRGRPTLLEIFLPLFFVLMAMDSRRHLPLAAIVLTPFLAKALADGAAQSIGRAVGQALPGLTKRLTADSRLTRELGPVEERLNWGLLGMALVLGTLLLPSQYQKFADAMNQHIGWRAVDFVADRGIVGRGLNEYGFGGYHMYRVRTGPGPFIDGRADTYGDAFVLEYLQIVNGLEGWEAAFDRHKIDYVVIPRTAPIRQLLLQRGDFEDVYRDDYNVVLVRKGIAPSLARKD